MSADSDAFQTVQTIPGLTLAEQQYLLAVARGEGFYGLGWGNTKAMSYQRTLEDAIRLGVDPQAGVGSNNWGAIQGKGSAGSFPHIDHHADGSVYVGDYKKYLTNTEGAADMARILLKPNVRAAIARGDLKAAVEAQRANGYFELAADQYLKAVKRNYDALTQSLKWPVLLTIGGAIGGGGMIAASPLAGSQLSESQPSSSGGLSTSNPTLSLGSQNLESVKELQKMLNALHYKLVVDGKFGPRTAVAVKHFQNNHGLKMDGIVGPVTWKVLHAKV